MISGTYPSEVKIRKGIKKPDRKIYQVQSVSKLSPEYFETLCEVKQKCFCKKDTMEKNVYSLFPNEKMPKNS